MKIIATIFLIVSSVSFGSTPESEAIRSKIKEHLKEVQTCYAPVAQSAESKGKVVVEWEVNDAGDVAIVSVNDAKTTLKNTTLHTCIIDKLKTWKFPAAPKGQTTAVSFPFIFSK
jgi:outer membrane biosynthesis protein TonB